MSIPDLLPLSRGLKQGGSALYPEKADPQRSRCLAHAKQKSP